MWRYRGTPVLLVAAAIIVGAIGVAYALTVSPSSGPAGTTISYSGTVGGATGPVANVQVTLTDPNGAVVASDTVGADADCNVSGTITVPAGSPPGTYTLLADASGTQCEGTDSGTFQVVAPTPPPATAPTTTVPTQPTQPTQRQRRPQRDRAAGGGDKGQAEAGAAEPITATPSFTG